jgi:hypothetical protein
MRESDKELIRSFLSSKKINEWISFGEMEVYVRKSKRYFPSIKDGFISCFDVANVNVIDGEQGKGKFTSFFDVVIELAQVQGYDAIYIESVINSKFAESLSKKKGMIEISTDKNQRNFVYKLK